MAVTSTINLQLTTTGDPGLSTRGTNLTVNKGSSVPNVTTQVFTGGSFAAVTVPTGATGVFIIPPTNNNGAITLKGVTGDTGIGLDQVNPSYISLAANPSFGLLCVNSITMEYIWV